MFLWVTVYTTHALVYLSERVDTAIFDNLAKIIGACALNTRAASSAHLIRGVHTLLAVNRTNLQPIACNDLMAYGLAKACTWLHVSN